MTQANDTTTKLVACLIINTYKLIGIDLRKQQAFNADPKAIQQINFRGNLEHARNTTLFIIKEVKETVLNFSQGTLKIL